LKFSFAQGSLTEQIFFATGIKFFKFAPALMHIANGWGFCGAQRFPKRSVSVTLSRACIPRETQGSRTQRRV